MRVATLAATGTDDVGETSSVASDATFDAGLAAALGTYLEIVDEVAAGLVEGLYVVGSAALDDWHPLHSDIDIVAVTAEPATEADAAQLRMAHALLAERQPLPHIDGPYVAWGDLIIEPTVSHRPWVFAGELHHDAECFEINPITWYTLATYGITVRGALPASLGISTDTEARIRFVIENLNTYWRTSQQVVASGCASGRQFTPADLEWCALGTLRLHYTAFTADVSSKSAAGQYGLDVTPTRFHDVIREALCSRSGIDVGLPASALMTRCAELMTWVIDDVNTASA